MKTYSKVSCIFLGVTLFLLCVCSVIVLYERLVIYPIKCREEVYENAQKYNLKESVIFSIIKIESNFNKEAESEKGAKGLMQITDNTAEFIAKKLGKIEYDIFDEKINIEFGSYYIRYLIDRFELVETAVVAYNAGESKVMAWLSDSRYSDDKKTLKEIPYKESKNYLLKFCKTLKKYNKLYENILDK